MKQRVVLLGCGTVGVGVLKRLQELPHRFEVVAIAVHDITKKRSKQVPTALLRDNPEEALAIPHDITIEVMGGLDLPLALIEKSIRAGRHVITANKEVIAQYGVRLEGLAKQEGKQLLYAASVGGAVPCIEAAIRLSESGPIEAAVGVLNGTTNFVLDEMAVGCSFEAAVHAAQKAGFAEADPTNDLNGADVARKLSILIRRGFGEYVASEDIRCEGIEEIGPKEVAKAKSRGEVIRLVAECRRSATGVDAWISPRYLPQSHPLARVRAERNAITFYRDGGPLETVNGKGAGRFPTAQAVIGDLWDLLFDLDAEGVANESDSRVHYLPRARSKPCAEAV